MLADGSIFEGELIGAERPVATGEVVFNTVLSGYQEVITDPSYAGQIITFTTPHIGNYGINAADFESRGTFCRGIVVRELARRHSNHRADSSLDAMLATARCAGHRRHRHPPPHPDPARHRRHARRVRIGPARPTSLRQPPPNREPTASTSSPGDHRRGLHRRRARSRQRHAHRRLRLRHEAQHRRQPRRASAPSRWCRRPRRAADILARTPRRRVPQQRPRRPGDGALRRRHDRAACSARCRSSASASAISCSAGRSAPAP